jgi:hypothetical protein
MCKPVSERFDLLMKNSQVHHSTNYREKDARMNASSETWQLDFPGTIIFRKWSECHIWEGSLR